jgi:hypothetical protein
MHGKTTAPDREHILMIVTNRNPYPQAAKYNIIKLFHKHSV